MKTVTFTKYEPSPKPVSKLTRIKYWFMRRGFYQKYVWKRYGKKVEITNIIGLSDEPR